MAPPRLTLVSNKQTAAGDAARRADASDAADASASGAGADAGAATADGKAEAEAKAVAGKTSAPLSTADRNERLRILEALLFAASEPLDLAKLAAYLPGGGEDAAELLEELKGYYRGRGINLVRVAGKWAFRTSEDLSYLLEKHATEERRLSKAALETMAIVAYHQPVTRAEIEEIRGVSTSAGTLDILLETGWVRPRGRRRAPGKPITYGTTDKFLEHFGLDGVKDLPGLAELKGSGLLDGNLPPGFTVPDPSDVAALMPDELPLDAGGDDDEVQAELELGSDRTAADDEEAGKPDEIENAADENADDDADSGGGHDRS